jgi:hypothetical protein
MKPFKTLLIGAAALSVAALATPSAQARDHHHKNNGKHYKYHRNSRVIVNPPYYRTYPHYYSYRPAYPYYYYDPYPRGYYYGGGGPVFSFSFGGHRYR